MVGQQVGCRSEGRQGIYGYMCAPVDAYIEKGIFGMVLLERCLGQKILGKIFWGIAYKDIRDCSRSGGSSAGRRVERS